MVVIVKASQLGNQTNLGDGGSLGLEGGYGEEPQENTEQYGVVMLVVPITTRGILNR